MISTFALRSLASPDERQQVAILRKELFWFWRDLSLCLVAMGRDQLWTAAGYLESMRRRCIDLLRLDQDFTQWAGGYEKLESAVREDDLTPLRDSFFTLDREAMEQAAISLVVQYRRLASRLVKRYNLEYPHALEKMMVRKLSNPRAN